jgi:hypothetical protein
MIHALNLKKTDKMNPTPQSVATNSVAKPRPVLPQITIAQPRPVLPQITDAQRRDVGRLVNFIEEEMKKISQALIEERAIINGCMELALRIEAIESNNCFVPIPAVATATVVASSANLPVPVPVNAPALMTTSVSDSAMATAPVPKRVAIVNKPSAMMSSKQVEATLVSASSSYKNFFQNVNTSCSNSTFSQLQELAKTKPKTSLSSKPISSSLPPVYDRDPTAKTSPLYLSTHLQLPASTMTAKEMHLVWTSHAPPVLEQPSPQQVPMEQFSPRQVPMREILWPSQSKKRDSEAMYKSQDFGYMSDSNDSQKTILITDEDIDGARILHDLSEPAQGHPKRKKQDISYKDISYKDISYEDIEESSDYLDEVQAKKRSTNTRKKRQTSKKSRK